MNLKRDQPTRLMVRLYSGPISVMILKVPVKRSQYFNRAAYGNIVGRNMLREFGHPVPCCDMLDVRQTDRQTDNLYLLIFKQHPT